MLPKETLELLLGTGRAQQGINKGDSGDAFFITPAGVATSLEKFFAPTRIKQHPRFTDSGSFCEYFNRFAGDASLIFANVGNNGASFGAVLDYHAPNPNKNIAQYCDHVATFETEDTAEWGAWQNANRKSMSQLEFAVWLEDNLHLFAGPEATGDKSAPSGADLLELVKSLHGHQNANFGQSIRLDNGAHSVKYEEVVNVQGNVQGGVMVLPPFIYGGFRLFHGTPPYMVKARLKSRIESRKLVLFFETVALEKTVRDCLNLVVEDISKSTKRTVLIGSPNPAA